MVKTIFRTILLLGVLGFSVLTFMDYMSVKNILALVLIGWVCLLTVGNIYRIFDELSSRVPYSPASVIVISALLCYLGDGDSNILLYCSIFLQFLEATIKTKVNIVGFSAMVVFYSSLIACIIKLSNDGVFNFFHIVILVTSCFPLLMTLLLQVSHLIIDDINNIIYNIILFFWEKAIYISCIILLIFSILLKVMHIDDSALFYTVMAIISMIGRTMKHKFYYENNNNL